jgi:hypothetical protein
MNGIIRQDKEIKEIQIEEIELSLFENDMILYWKDSSPQKITPRHPKCFQQSSRMQNSICEYQ